MKYLFRTIFLLEYERKEYRCNIPTQGTTAVGSRQSNVFNYTYGVCFILFSLKNKLSINRDPPAKAARPGVNTGKKDNGRREMKETGGESSPRMGDGGVN